MTLKEYIDVLKKILEENPDSENNDVIHYDHQTGKYTKIYGASFGHLFKDQEYFFDKEEFEEWKEEMVNSEEKLNAILIN